MKYVREILLLTAIILLTTSFAYAQDCKYHNFKLDYKSYGEPDPGDYSICYRFNKVRGTLTGIYTSCKHDGEWGTTHDVWGDGSTLELGKYYSTFETPDGDLEIQDYVFFDAFLGTEAGFSTVIGGTDAFDGAFGTLMISEPSPDWKPFLELKGFICTE